MSRPSRGTSRGVDTVSPVPACPTSGSLSVEIAGPSEWDLTVTWSPPVVVVTLTYYASINGGAEFVIAGGGPVTTPDEQSVDPSTFADPGDVVNIRAVATDVILCGDFVTNTTTNIFE